MLPDLKNHKIRLIHKEGVYAHTILTTSMVFKIRTVLDLRYKYSTIWKLMFSTYEDGFSYSGMLGTFKKNTGPYLLVVKDSQRIHGVYFEEPLEISLRPFGRRKRFIFKIEDGEIEVNALDLVLDQIVCSEEYLSFGYDQKGYKFLLDKSLMKGQVYFENIAVEYLEVYSIME